MTNVVTRIPAAGPELVSGIKTRLRKFGGIDTEQLNSFLVMPKRVAVMSKPMLSCGHGATGEHEGESEGQSAHGRAMLLLRLPVVSKRDRFEISVGLAGVIFLDPILMPIRPVSMPRSGELMG